MCYLKQSPDFFFFALKKINPDMSRFLNSLWEKKIWTCPDLNSSFRNKKIGQKKISTKFWSKKFWSKIWSKIFWSKTLSKIRLLQIFLFLREKSKSGQVRIFFSQREIENLDTSRFFIFNVKIKIRTRPDFYFSMQNFRSGLGDM